MSEDIAGLRDLLGKLWEKNLPLLQERVSVIQSAVEAAAHGELDAALRARAVDEAHKLAGSLGMFGYPQGTELARRVEVALGEGTPVDLRGVVAELRALVVPH